MMVIDSPMNGENADFCSRAPYLAGIVLDFVGLTAEEVRRWRFPVCDG